MTSFQNLKIQSLSAVLAMLVSTNLFAETIHIASDDKQVALVELFTSEGCSSCPPAEAWMNKFVKDEGLWKRVIPMAFHVDYWDYIGWKDRFAQSRFSDRQYRYQKEGGIRTVYTPGVLVNGDEWRSFGKQPSSTDEKVGSLMLDISDSGVSAKFDSVRKKAGALKLHLAVLAFGLTTEVAAGENRGRQLPHEFVVVGVNETVSSDLRWQAVLPEIKNTNASRHAIVAWVSETDSQRPLQATGGWLPASLLSSGG